MQMSSGQRVSTSALQPGDLVFYGSPVHHVALYVGGGQVIHAPQTGDVVRYASVDMMPITGAVRP
jgi:cell wall-associated NlpC family hydrolase